eukprot:COSAG01_NODE_2010_length_8657_cov_6.034237_5_plen_204_part_00
MAATGAVIVRLPVATHADHGAHTLRVAVRGACTSARSHTTARNSLRRDCWLRYASVCAILPSSAVVRLETRSARSLVHHPRLPSIAALSLQFMDVLAHAVQITSLLFSVVVFFGCGMQGSFAIFAFACTRSDLTSVVRYALNVGSCSSDYLTTMMGIVLAYGVAALVPTMEAANAILPTYVTTCMYVMVMISLSPFAADTCRN